MQKCEVRIYMGMGQERRCGKQAVAILDAGKPNECPVCRECREFCEPSRLTEIEEEVES